MKVISKITLEIKREIGIGEGRNSKVYLAYDPQLNGDVALKQIPIKDFSNSNEYFKEATILYANSSPNVVPISYACLDNDFINIVMPYYPKGSVLNTIKNQPTTTRQLIKWAQEFLNGIHYVHINNFIHFDIKPSNILIHNDGSALISDFGQTRPANILGTTSFPPLYEIHFPPERFQFDKTTKQTDIYQIGLTLYRMCNGEDHFKKQIKPSKPDFYTSIKSGKFPDRNNFLPHIPRRLKRIIRKLLKVDPLKRYQTVIDLQNDLGQIDTLLDWSYINLDNETIWRKENITHISEIKKSSKTNCFKVEGYMIRKSDSNKRKRNDWSSGILRNDKEADNFVAEIFKKMEVDGKS